MDNQVLLRNDLWSYLTMCFKIFNIFDKLPKNQIPNEVFLTMN